MKRHHTQRPPGPLLVLICMSIVLASASAQSQTQNQDNDAHRLPQFRQHAAVEIKVDGKTYKLSPNEIGAFPQIQVQPSDTIIIKVAYQGGNPGEGVDVQVEDGGTIVESKSIGHHAKLDHGGQFTFTFQTTTQLGIYRVILRKGVDVKELNFWAGAPQPQGAPVTKIPNF